MMDAARDVIPAREVFPMLGVKQHSGRLASQLRQYGLDPVHTSVGAKQVRAKYRVADVVAAKERLQKKQQSAPLKAAQPELPLQAPVWSTPAQKTAADARLAELMEFVGTKLGIHLNEIVATQGFVEDLVALVGRLVNRVGAMEQKLDIAAAKIETITATNTRLLTIMEKMKHE